MPCGLTAIRGSHPGSFQAAQALRYRRLPSCPTTPASAAASSSWRGHQRSRRCAFPSRASRTGQPHSPARQSRPLRRSSTQHLPFHDQLGLKSARILRSRNVRRRPAHPRYRQDDDRTSTRAGTVLKARDQIIEIETGAVEDSLVYATRARDHREQHYSERARTRVALCLTPVSGDFLRWVNLRV